MIYIVRQGQTDWNLHRRFNGSTETELNQTGRAQAAVHAENLKGVGLEACFCSPQKRARQTCDIIYKGPIKPDDRLAEIGCGAFEGAEETPEALKRFWRAIMTGEMGAERFEDFNRRNCDFCDMITDAYAGKNVLIVTHAANARVINYYFSGKPADYDFTKAAAQNGGLLTFDN